MGSCGSTANTRAARVPGAAPVDGEAPVVRSAGAPSVWAEKPVTYEELRARREEFWSTRVTNNEAMWNVMRLASEALLEGDSATATAIVEAAGLRSPNGSLSLAYDERGAEYRVPEYCYMKPKNMISSVGTHIPKKIPSNVPSKALTVRVRVVGHPKDYPLEVKDTDEILQVKEALSVLISENPHEASSVVELPAKRMRMIYSGKVLKNGTDLRGSGVKHNTVLQIFPLPEGSA
mmetsp:Transcript_24402/g.71614  ORF Transcript_24402/g.71614 Transcript_24402/m.71614 type:complete len:234 (-) Transcript_24402:270-971(-)